MATDRSIYWMVSLGDPKVKRPGLVRYSLDYLYPRHLSALVRLYTYMRMTHELHPE